MPVLVHDHSSYSSESCLCLDAEPMLLHDV